MVLKIFLSWLKYRQKGDEMCKYARKMRFGFLIEQIEMSDSNLRLEEVIRLINALIDNHRIKDVIMKSCV